MRASWALATAATLAAGAIGCGTSDGTVRVVDGRAVHGAYVPAEAYAAFLRGAIAESTGDLAGAVEGYSIAVALGPSDAEAWVRLGAAECAREPRDPKADAAFEKALDVDGAYAPAWAARARCAERRGDSRTAALGAARAVALDTADAGSLALLAQAHPQEGAAADALRAELVALTLVHGSDVVAWDALGAWARRRGDAVLEGRAVAHVAALAPSRGAQVDAAVLRLSAEGWGTTARAVARVRMATLQGSSVDARVVRLAIDDAIVSGHVDAARRIATKAHVPLAVVAARSLLAGEAATARALAMELLAADPHSASAALVLAVAADALGDAPLVTRALAARRARTMGNDENVPVEVWLAYVHAVARGGDDADLAAQSVVRGLQRDPILAGDATVTSVAVALAARGILDVSELDANARVELAERRGEVVPEALARDADARHHLLALARSAPRDPATRSLAAKLAPARAEDSIVAVALARIALASDTASAASAGTLLVHFDPADPLVASAALDCALRSGDARAIPLAKRRLAAVAGTPAEHARVE